MSWLSITPATCTAAARFLITGELFTMPSHISELIARLERSLAAKPARSVLAGEETLAAGELLSRARALAKTIAGTQAPIVAWTLDNSWRWVVTDLACLMVGRIAVPIPDFFTPAQCSAVIRQLGPTLWIGTNARELPTDLSPSLPPIETPIAGLRGFSLNESTAPPSIPPGTTKITFTSGSTGEPKGVCLDEALLLQVADSINQRLGTDLNRQSQLAVTPLAVLLENIAGLYRTLLAGGTYILPAAAQRPVSGSSGLDTARLAQALIDHQPGLMIAAPRMLPALSAMGGGRALTSLNYIAVGGAPVPAGSIQAARDAGIPVYQGYGLSECGSVVSLNTPDDDDPQSVGRPLAHIRTNLSANGTLQIHGAAYRGYLGQHPQGNDLIETGDQATIDKAGRIHFKGRLGQRIITDMGRNVSPEWVEATLEREAPGLIACVIEHSGGVAALIGNDGPADRDLTQAIQAANRALPDYARIRSWARAPEPFTVNNGCLTGTGRPRRARIAECYAHYLEPAQQEQTCIPS